ncbi:MAG: HAMP domain-containing sensor histidine kinase [Kofleriaceae bacterium]
MYSARFLLDDDALTAEAHSAGEDIALAAAQLDRMATSLLDLSRAEDGLMQARTERLDLAKLAHDVLRSYRALLERKHVTVELVADEAPFIDGDRALLQRVLTNLVDNALKYGGPGSLRIETRCCGDAVELRVADHGPGIPERDRKRVFRRFSRLDRDAATEATRSHGLGLAFCQQAVAAHGGAIWVEASEPSGATFVVRLPARPAAAARRPAGCPTRRTTAPEGETNRRARPRTSTPARPARDTIVNSPA